MSKQRKERCKQILKQGFTTRQTGHSLTHLATSTQFLAGGWYGCVYTHLATRDGTSAWTGVHRHTTFAHAVAPSQHDPPSTHLCSEAPQTILGCVMMQVVGLQDPGGCVDSPGLRSHATRVAQQLKGSCAGLQHWQWTNLRADGSRR